MTCYVFIFSSVYFLVLFVISSLTHGYLKVCFLISKCWRFFKFFSFVDLQFDSIEISEHCLISIIFNLLKLALYTSIWSLLEKAPCHWKKHLFCYLNRESFIYQFAGGSVHVIFIFTNFLSACFINYFDRIIEISTTVCLFFLSFCQFLLYLFCGCF